MSDSAPSAWATYDHHVAKLWTQLSDLELQLTTVEPTPQQTMLLASLTKSIAMAEARRDKAKRDAPAAAAQASGRPSFSSKDHFRPPDLDKNPHFRCNPELPAFPLAQYLQTIGTDLMSSGGYTISDLPRCLAVCLSDCSHATRNWYLVDVLARATELSVSERPEMAWAFCKAQLLAKFPQPEQHFVYSTALHSAAQGDQTIQAFNNWWLETMALAGLEDTNSSLLPMYLKALSSPYRAAYSRHVDTLMVQDVAKATASQTLKAAMTITNNLSYTAEFQWKPVAAKPVTPRPPRPMGPAMGPGEAPLRHRPAVSLATSLRAASSTICFSCGQQGHKSVSCPSAASPAVAPPVPFARPALAPLLATTPSPAPTGPSPAPFAARPPPRTPMPLATPRANLFATPNARLSLTPATPSFNVHGVPVRRVVLDDGTEFWMPEYQLQEPSVMSSEVPDIMDGSDDDDDPASDDRLAASLGDVHLRPP